MRIHQNYSSSDIILQPRNATNYYSYKRGKKKQKNKNDDKVNELKAKTNKKKKMNQLFTFIQRTEMKNKIFFVCQRSMQYLNHFFITLLILKKKPIRVPHEI